MSIRTDIYTIDWSVNPRVIWIDIAQTEASVQDMYDTVRHLEPLNMSEPPLTDAGGKEPLGGGVLVGITVSLFDAVYAFADRPGPDWVICNMTGGNVVAFEDVTRTVEIYPRKPTSYVSADRSSSSSATQSEQDALRYASYQGAVWLDVTSSNVGTLYPSGNVEYPVNNVIDATEICNELGFRVIQVLGNLTTNDVLHDIRDLKLIGVSHVNSELIIGEDTQCLRTSFEGFKISGFLDGDSEIVNCIVEDLTYFNGHIHNSYLAGTIALRGAEGANITECSILDIQDTPIIDAGGTGQDLMMPNFSGRVVIANLTGNSQLGIGLSSGDVIVDSTCTAGAIAISGSGKVYDNSSAGCYVVDTVIDGTMVSNLSRLVEMQRPHHTGTGQIWFWDPVNGNDNWQGDNAHRATKTFAAAHSLAKDNNHDIIICVAGDNTGSTLVHENIVITKNYIFVRGPGRDFTLHSLIDNLPTIDIQSNGVEISSMVLSSEITNTESCIKCSGSFPYLKDLYIEDSVNGIDIIDGDHGIIDNTRVGHNSGYGINITGNSEHFVIKDSHIGSNGNNGIIIDINTGHEVIIEGRTIVHSNTGYGVSISPTSNEIFLSKDVSVYNNTVGGILDNGIGTVIDKEADIQNIVTSVWAGLRDNNQVSGSHGEAIKDIHLAETGRRKSLGLVDTIYEDDLVTPRKEFDITKDLDGVVVEIVPK